MKKPTPPKATKGELMQEALFLLRLRWPSMSEEPVQHLLTYFNGWDLEEIIRHLKMDWK